MFKKILFGLVAVVGLASCNGDYTDWSSPQSNAENPISTADLTVSYKITSVDCGKYQETDSIQLLDIQKSEDVTDGEYTIIMNVPGATDKTYKVNATNKGMVAVNDLHGAVKYLYNAQAVERELSATVTASNITVKTSDGVISSFYKGEATTLKVTPFAPKFTEWYYVVGATTDWKFDASPALRSPELDGKYTGYAYLNGGWKVAPEKAWGQDIGYAAFNKVSENITSSSDGNLVCDEGVYYIELDLNDYSITAIKITNMNLVGSINSWNEKDDAMQMTWAADKCTFTKTITVTDDQQFKFTANNGWDINFGANDTTEPSKLYVDLVQNGKNLYIGNGTWKITLYPCRINTEKVYCTIEKE